MKKIVNCAFGFTIGAVISTAPMDEAFDQKYTEIDGTIAEKKLEPLIVAGWITDGGSSHNSISITTATNNLL